MYAIARGACVTVQHPSARAQPHRRTVHAGSRTGGMPAGRPSASPPTVPEPYEATQKEMSTCLGWSMRGAALACCVARRSSLHSKEVSVTGHRCKVVVTTAVPNCSSWSQQVVLHATIEAGAVISLITTGWCTLTVHLCTCTCKVVKRGPERSTSGGVVKDSVSVQVAPRRLIL